MKNSLILLFFITLSLSAQIHGNADIGKDLEKEWYFTNINVGYIFDLWKFENDVFTGVKTFFLIDNFPWVSSMLRSIYTVGYELNYSIFYFKIWHFCSHPTISSWYEQPRFSKDMWDTSSTEIKIGIKW